MNNTRHALEGLLVGTLTVIGLTLPFKHPLVAILFAVTLFVVSLWQSKKHPRKSIFDQYET